MRIITSVLKNWPFHILLIPIFFLLHNYARYYGLVNYDAVQAVFVSILLGILILFLLSWIVTRDIKRSFLFSSLISIVFLFFGDFKDLFEGTAVSFLAKYIVLIPVLFILAVLIYRAIVKKDKVGQANLFLNIFFLLSVIADLIIFQYSQERALLQKNVMVRPAQNYRLALNPERPDVYYLLFDSYPRNDMLKKYMEFSNDSFENSLSDAGFRIIKNSASNYNRTVFSMASLLNFQYLNNGLDFSPITAKDYNIAILTIKNAAVPGMFKNANYQLHNLSIFNYHETKAVSDETFLTLPSKTVLAYNTLPVRLKKDLGWMFITGKYATDFTRKFMGDNQKMLMEHQTGKKITNKLMYDSVLNISRETGAKPRFVYAHFHMPHPPFFFDEAGNPTEMSKAVNNTELKSKKEFIAYLRYTNSVILGLVNQIQKSTQKRAVIVIQSDHGYTDFEGRPDEIETVFQNFSAFYFPDGNYDTLYDSMSNVNAFPVIFNKYLGTSIPLQKDTSIFLKY